MVKKCRGRPKLRLIDNLKKINGLNMVKAKRKEHNWQTLEKKLVQRVTAVKHKQTINDDEQMLIIWWMIYKLWLMVLKLYFNLRLNGALLYLFYNSLEEVYLPFTRRDR